MLELRQANPVKIFVAAFWTDPDAWENAIGQMSRQWGQPDARTPSTPFTVTDYYVAEMGADIRRELVSFPRLVDPGALAELKLFTNEIEHDLTAGRRRVNLDVGYLDYHRVVLASTKEGPHKVYLGNGIWADLTLLYRAKALHPLPWTFADFASGAYDKFLLEMRGRYRQQMRQQVIPRPID